MSTAIERYVASMKLTGANAEEQMHIRASVLEVLRAVQAGRMTFREARQELLVAAGQSLANKIVARVMEARANREAGNN